MNPGFDHRAELHPPLPAGRRAVRHPDRPFPVAAALLMLASGFAGLGYQIVWTQQGALWLGHEQAAVLAVVAAFFGGLALGAWALGRRIEASAQPARWYAACEALVAAWGLLLLLLMQPFSAAALALTGPQPHPLWQGLVAFAGTGLLLLPATAAMGATLPAMAGVLARLQRQGQSIAALYAANTAGALLGVLGTAFWLVPQWGLMRTAALCAALNLLCAATAWRVFGAADSASASAGAAAAPCADAAAVVPAMASPAASTEAGPRATRLRLQLAATGLLGIAYEVLVVRVLSQVSEDTVYTFALLLAVYLLFTALGATAWQRWGPPLTAIVSDSDSDSDSDSNGNDSHGSAATDRLLAALAAACALGSASLWFAPDLRSGWAAAFGNSLVAALSAEAALAGAAFALPTFVMGALFSQLCRRAQRRGIGLARALAINTLGAAAAPLLFGVLLAPALGSKFALLLVAAGYLLLAGRSLWRRASALLPAGTLAALAALAVAAPPLTFLDVPDGGRVVSLVEGAMAAVGVVEDADGVRRLRINNRQQEGSSATRYFDARQALLPLLLHPAPQRALFLGLGTGVTAAAAADEPGLRVDAAELLPEVIAASTLFTPGSRARIVAADARRYVRTTAQRYDVIVSDNFHPARSGSGALYTVEHFAAVRARLASADGLFCQWLPLHQMDMATLRSIVKSFTTVFPGGHALLATNSLLTPTLGLVGRADDGRQALPALQQRLLAANAPAQAQSRPRLEALGLADAYAVLGSFVAGPRALAAFAAAAAANTDDHPVVAYRAPRLTYLAEGPSEGQAEGQPAERLLRLLDAFSIQPAELLADTPGGDAGFAQRLAAYWQARQRYIASGRDVRPAADAQQMLQQVREPLLAVLRISADFQPAYDPLLRLARSLATSDPAAARRLLGELAAAAPARPEAGQALEQLAASAP